MHVITSLVPGHTAAWHGTLCCRKSQRNDYTIADPQEYNLPLGRPLDTLHDWVQASMASLHTQHDTSGTAQRGIKQHSTPLQAIIALHSMA